MLGPPINGLVVTRCACCDQRLSRSEEMSCAGYSRNVVRRSRVDVIAVFLSGM